MHLPLMDMAERPIVETVPLKVGDAARGVGIMRGGSGKAGMQHADIDAARDRRMELRQQAFRRMRIGKAHAMDMHGAAIRKRLGKNRPAPA